MKIKLSKIDQKQQMTKQFTQILALAPIILLILCLISNSKADTLRHHQGNKRPVVSYLDEICKRYKKSLPSNQAKHYICHNMGILGEDDRIFLHESNNSKLKAEGAKNPIVEFCGAFSTGIIARSKDFEKDLLIVSAHTVFDGIGGVKTYTKKVKDKKTGQTRESVTKRSINEAIESFIMVSFFMSDKSNAIKHKLDLSILENQPINDLTKAMHHDETGEDYLIFPIKRKVSNDVNPFTKKPRGYVKFLKPGRYKRTFNQLATTIAYHSDMDFKPVTMSSPYEIKESPGELKVKGYKTLFGDFLETTADTKAGSSGSPHFISENDELVVFAQYQFEHNTKANSVKSILGNYLIKSEKMVSNYNLITACKPFESKQKKSSLKSSFNDHTKKKRKTIQSSLKHYYKSTIDGAWGQKTESAIESYAKDYCYEDLLYSNDGIETLFSKIIENANTKTVN